MRASAAAIVASSAGAGSTEPAGVVIRRSRSRAAALPAGSIVPAWFAATTLRSWSASDRPIDSRPPRSSERICAPSWLGRDEVLLRGRRRDRGGAGAGRPGRGARSSAAHHERGHDEQRPGEQGASEEQGGRDGGRMEHRRIVRRTRRGGSGWACHVGSDRTALDEIGIQGPGVANQAEKGIDTVVSSHYHPRMPRREHPPRSRPRGRIAPPAPATACRRTSAASRWWRLR